MNEPAAPFSYLSTDFETYFRNNLDPVPRSYRTFAFHKPETLAGWVEAYLDGKGTLRGRLQILPAQHSLIEDNLWPPKRRPSEI